jgi:hypothetical protein
MAKGKAAKGKTAAGAAPTPGPLALPGLLLVALDEEVDTFQVTPTPPPP